MMLGNLAVMLNGGSFFNILPVSSTMAAASRK